MLSTDLNDFAHYTLNTNILTSARIKPYEETALVNGRAESASFDKARSICSIVVKLRITLM